MLLPFGEPLQVLGGSQPLPDLLGPSPETQDSETQIVAFSLQTAPCGLETSWEAATCHARRAA